MNQMKKRRSQKHPHMSPIVRVIEEPAISGLQDQIWREEKVDELPEGITLKRDGRAGYLYFRRGNRFIAIDAEVAGDAEFDIVLFVPDSLQWVDVRTFERTPLS